MSSQGSGKDFFSERLSNRCWGRQFQKYILTLENKAKGASSALPPEKDGWQFIQEHGEVGKTDLKQLKWLFPYINLEHSPTMVGKSVLSRRR